MKYWRMALIMQTSLLQLFPHTLPLSICPIPFSPFLLSKAQVFMRSFVRMWCLCYNMFQKFVVISWTLTKPSISYRQTNITRIIPSINISRKLCLCCENRIVNDCWKYLQIWNKKWIPATFRRAPCIFVIVGTCTRAAPPLTRKRNELSEKPFSILGTKTSQSNPILHLCSCLQKLCFNLQFFLKTILAQWGAFSILNSLYSGLSHCIIKYFPESIWNCAQHFSFATFSKWSQLRNHV